QQRQPAVLCLRPRRGRCGFRKVGVVALGVVGAGATERLHTRATIGGVRICCWRADLKGVLRSRLKVGNIRMTRSLGRACVYKCKKTSVVHVQLTPPYLNT